MKKNWSFESYVLGANGFDVVAYQTLDAAVPGMSEYYSFLEGVNYLFSSSANKDLFDANPQKYLPAYGGYCAMAMAMNKKHPSDSGAFGVVDGKLYLTKKTALKLWLEDVSGHIKKADAFWLKDEDIDPNLLA